MSLNRFGNFRWTRRVRRSDSGKASSSNGSELMDFKPWLGSVVPCQWSWPISWLLNLEVHTSNSIISAMLVLSVSCSSEFEPLTWLVLWSGLRRRLLVLNNSCARTNTFMRHFLFLSHPFEWFFKAAGVVKERPQQHINEDISSRCRCAKTPLLDWTVTVSSWRVTAQTHTPIGPWEASPVRHCHDIRSALTQRITYSKLQVMSKYIMRIHTWHYYVNGGVPHGQFEIQSKCNVMIQIPYKVVCLQASTQQ